MNQEIQNQIEDEIKKKGERLDWTVKRYNKKGNKDIYTLNNGIIFKSVDRILADEIFQKFHDTLLVEGDYLFLTNLKFNVKKRQVFNDIVVVKCSNQFELVRLVGTQGLNYEVYNEDIIEKLIEWHELIDLKIKFIDRDRLNGTMGKLPKDLVKFAGDVYEFCSDVIEGPSEFHELIENYSKNKYFWLWWD